MTSSVKMQSIIQKYRMNLSTSPWDAPTTLEHIFLDMTQHRKILVQAFVTYLYTGVMEKSRLRMNEIEQLAKLLDEYGVLSRDVSTADDTKSSDHMDSNKQKAKSVVEERQTKSLAEEVTGNAQLDDVHRDSHFRSGNSKVTNEIKKEIDTDYVIGDSSTSDGYDRSNKGHQEGGSDYQNTGLQVKAEPYDEEDPRSGRENNSNDNNRQDDTNMNVNDDTNLDNNAKVHDDIIDISDNEDVRRCNPTGKYDDASHDDKMDGDMEVPQNTDLGNEETEPRERDLNDLYMDVFTNSSASQGNKELTVNVSAPFIDPAQSQKLSVQRPKAINVVKQGSRKIFNMRLLSDHLKDVKGVATHSLNKSKPIVHDVGKSQLQKNREVHSCYNCDMTFKSYSDLIKHIRETEMDFANPKKPKQKKLKNQCPTCDEVFPLYKDLLRHKKMHDSPTLCTICGKSFQDKKYIYQHMRIHATGRPLTMLILPTASEQQTC